MPAPETRKIDLYLVKYGEDWEIKSVAGRTDDQQLEDMRAMKNAGYVYTTDGIRRPTNSSNYLAYVDIDGAIVNSHAAISVSEFYYVDDFGNAKLLR